MFLLRIAIPLLMTSGNEQLSKNSSCPRDCNASKLSSNFSPDLNSQYSLSSRVNPHQTGFPLASGKPVWCGLTREDNEYCELRSGEKLLDSLLALQSLGQEEFLLNCSFPEVINNGIAILSKNTNFFGGYANGFTSIEPLKTASNVSVLSARTDLGLSLIHI